ncbi:peptidyl-tRNA hydrolase [Tricladium varicosporioides]|nr:peptidyl-tRNA hydrolase [Hymenoscyphus varicosporioides]
MAVPLRLLVCSIGNPAPYTNTLHSAGHTVLNSLASSLGYPAFQKSKSYDGAVSIGPDFMLWQSRSLMNVSGKGVAAAWRQFQKESRGEPTRLVVVHDELELPFGDVRVKDGALSARGHNGLKDITQRLGGAKYMRVCVGIGRPESRDPSVVAAYVLRKMNGSEMGKIVGAAGKVEMELRRLGGML